MSASAGIVIWGHALTALLFGALGVWTLRLDAKRMPRIPFAIALIATALWALSVAGIGEGKPGVDLAHGVRDLAWLGVLLLLHRTLRPENGFASIGSVYAVVALVLITTMVLRLLARISEQPAVAEAIDQAAMTLAMMTAIAGLWLVQGLMNGAGGRTRWAIALAPAALWMLDLVALGTRYAFPDAGWVHGLRGIVLGLVGALLAIGLHRADQWNLRVSRMVALQSMSFVAAGLYLVFVAGGASAIAQFGGSRAVQTVFIFAATTTALAALSSPHLRAWLRVKLAKHFYRHRYDYRTEWIRFTDTLGSGETSLQARIVKAVADLTESPGGVLMVPSGAGLDIAAQWRWDGVALHPGEGADTLLSHLAATRRVIELDAVRRGKAEPADAAAVPGWLCDAASGWVIVPLPHGDRLAGVILLGRPAVERPLDWEDFDLLKIAGRQVASHLAENRAQEALAEAKRFDEFNRRFAFILHDIKNLVSQLSLVARNAERHADNPEFRADMVATLNESAGRMNALLAKLSQHHQARAEPMTPVVLHRLADMVTAKRKGHHPIILSGDATATAIGDPARIEQILSHLIQNAIDASAPDEAIILRIGDDGAGATIDVVDRGSGMSPGFVRDRLFKPFDSTKAGGFGIGAFEARQLAETMHGRLDVHSREGEGTRFRLTLPRFDSNGADTHPMEFAA